jgi:hypothetical protein
MLTAICSAITLLGPFLPWLVIFSDQEEIAGRSPSMDVREIWGPGKLMSGELHSWNGLQVFFDGRYVLALASIALVSCMLRGIVTRGVIARVFRYACCVALVGAAIIAGHDLLAEDEMLFPGTRVVHYGFGIYLTLAAAALGAVFSLLWRRDRFPNESASDPIEAMDEVVPL